MIHEKEHLRYINIVIKQLNSLIDDVYEDLVDYEYESAREKIKEILEVFDDLNKSISNEI